jgi:hypothetical protein
MSDLSALVAQKLYWLPASIFDVFDALRLGIFDPRTGTYGVYATAGAALTPAGAVLWIVSQDVV